MAKIGLDAPSGTLTARKGTLLFHISAATDPKGVYPDGGCSQEVYTNPDPLKYVEMELLGPLHRLRPGGTAVLVTRWTLERAEANR